MSPVLKPWGTSQDGFRPWGVRTKPRLFGHGLSHRSVPATSKPGHAAQGLQVGGESRESRETTTQESPPPEGRGRRGQLGPHPGVEAQCDPPPGANGYLGPP